MVIGDLIALWAAAISDGVVDYTALREVIDSPDVQARFKNVGFEGFSSTPEELAAFIKVQLGVWEKMVKGADIKPN
jgi:tripartite-type tricarboxylate transporter receptor subunit TctC